MATSSQKFFVVFTLIVWWLFGAFAAISAVAGVVLLFISPMAGIVALVLAVLLAVMSWQVKRTWASLTTE